MAAQEKNIQEIAKAKKLDHVPGGEEYEKIISGMLYVYNQFHQCSFCFFSYDPFDVSTRRNRNFLAFP